MNARGTRRPHARRPRPKPIKRSGGGSDGKGGCVVVAIAALSGLLAVVTGGAEVIWWVL